MNPYHELVGQVARLRNVGRGLPLGDLEPCPLVDIPDDAPVALVFSPHPDDECIVGGLPLRLLREARWRILNVAVTQGSNKERQAARYAELKGACRFLQFELVQTAPGGLERIHLKSRNSDTAHWRVCAQTIAAILSRYQPRLVFFPHDRDWNSTHIGTHHLVVDALTTLPGFACYTCETEFWGAMDDPNLMIESRPADVADLMAACSFHVGEVRRNPYHLSQTAWMQDNVRRGGELVGGQGGAAPDFLFATLYRLRRWEAGAWVSIFTGGRHLSADDSPGSLFG